MRDSSAWDFQRDVLEMLFCVYVKNHFETVYLTEFQFLLALCPLTFVCFQWLGGEQSNVVTKKWCLCGSQPPFISHGSPDRVCPLGVVKASLSWVFPLCQSQHWVFRTHVSVSSQSQGLPILSPVCKWGTKVQNDGTCPRLIPNIVRAAQD